MSVTSPAFCDDGPPVWLRLASTIWGKAETHVDTAYVQVREGNVVPLDLFFDWPYLWNEPDPELGILATRPGKVLLRTTQPLFRDAPRETLIVGKAVIELTSHSYDGGITLNVVVIDSPPPGTREGIALSTLGPPPEESNANPRAVVRPPLRLPFAYRGPWGDVMLAVAVNGRGRPDSVVVTKSLGSPADSFAVANVRNWTFWPARRQGFVVSARKIVRLRFHDPTRYHWTGKWPR